MTPKAKREYLDAIRARYAAASRAVKSQLLTEACATLGYHRKAAIRAFARPPRTTPPCHRSGRPSPYGPRTVTLLMHIWEAAGYPWSVRLKALLPLWLPWAKRRFTISPTVERALRTISPRTIDRRLGQKKRHLNRRLYGRTKPGTLLKHHIPVRTEHWAVTEPGFTEVDLVSHSGTSADGEFLYSLNLTDIHSGWVETRALLGKSQLAVRAAIDDIRTALPFALRGLDSDNGSEFINQHLFQYCAARDIQFTRGRPYKKDDNAHIEQKNWTHVRKLLGWDRYASPTALAAINALYRQDLRLMMNLFQPSVKLQRTKRTGSRRRRFYDAPQTPLDRLLTSQGATTAQLKTLRRLRARLDPFALSESIERQLRHIYTLIHRGPITPTRHPLPHQRFEIHRRPPLPRVAAGRR
ncbi:MAG TPA: integrase [bacterium]|nr:integrase [bacterium]